LQGDPNVLAVFPSSNVQDFNLGFNGGTADNGDVTSMTATGTQNFSRSYSYDALNRLATMSDSNTSQTCRGLSWNYDAWGNRTDQTQTAGTCGEFHASANAQNRIVDLVNGVYKYDAAGNLTNDGSHTYIYDAENRLTQVDGTPGNCSTASACYMYDAEGHRARKIIGSAARDFFFDLSGNVVAEVTTPGWQVGYAYLNGQLIAQYKNSTTYFVHSDHLGSSRLLTGMNQAVVQNLDYLPFGEITSSDSGISTHKFTGDEHDAETSFDHTQFRQYTSQLARWITPDPAGLAAVDPGNPQSWNRYSYVLNSPVNLIDPSGLCSWIRDSDGNFRCYGGYAPADAGIIFGDDGGDGWGYCAPEFQTCYPPGGGIGIGIEFGGGGGTPSNPAPQPSPIAPSAPQIANTCQLTGTCSTDIVCQYGFCSTGPQFGQGFVAGVDDVIEIGALIRILVWGAAAVEAAVIAINQLSKRLVKVTVSCHIVDISDQSEANILGTVQGTGVGLNFQQALNAARRVAGAIAQARFPTRRVYVRHCQAI
jgi:RHS repeat-associated protein